MLSFMDEEKSDMIKLEMLKAKNDNLDVLLQNF
jgi:hypothetical protein